MHAARLFHSHCLPGWVDLLPQAVKEATTWTRRQQQQHQVVQQQPGKMVLEEETSSIRPGLDNWAKRLGVDLLRRRNV